MTITREQLFAAAKPVSRTHKSDVFGGDIKYHLATVGEKGKARKLATTPEGLDNELLEAYLNILCIDDPKLAEIDIDEVKKLPAGEVTTIAGLILGKAAQPPK